MLPIKDENPTRRVSVITYGLIGLCIIVYLYQGSLSVGEENSLLLGLGMIPVVVLGSDSLPPELVMVPALLTPVTSMFLHGDIFHLGGNMLYLWIFGNNVEDAMGRGRFLVFYLVCGIAAAMLHALQTPGSVAPMIGASGAISGVLGAYLLLFPLARVLVYFGLVFVFWVPAAVVLGLWFGLQALSVLGDPQGADTGIAWWAHLGGFAVGMALIPLFKRRDVLLFNRKPTVSRVSVIPAVGAGRHRRRGPWDAPSGPWGAGRPK
jgi:membrane associated rhomboid family serine protease